MIMGEEKSLTIDRSTISIDGKISKKAKKLCEDKNQKFSNYIQSLIERDLSGETAPPTADSETPVTDLYKTFFAAMAPAIEKWCTEREIDQKALLSDVLVKLSNMARLNLDPSTLVMQSHAEPVRQPSDQPPAKKRAKREIPYVPPIVSEELQEQWKAAQDNARKQDAAKAAKTKA